MPNSSISDDPIVDLNIEWVEIIIGQVMIHDPNYFTPEQQGVGEYHIGGDDVVQ